jgi:energy-coupling factor transporter ATP-binding protein EcfA2
MAKRITILAGHYGSGKTNIAVGLAFLIKHQGEEVSVVDLDIVNPYFRTKDSAEEFEKAGIPLICSPYANSNVDIPALPQEIYAVIDNRDRKFVLDVGGDDRGALALGRLSPAIREEANYEMLLVANFFRPLTPDADSMLEVMREMEVASGLSFTGVIHNSNLGNLTTAEDVLSKVPLAEEFAQKANLPLVMTTVCEELFDSLHTKIENLFPLKLQKKYY